MRLKTLASASVGALLLSLASGNDARATIIDITAPGSSGVLDNGAVFIQAESHPTGSGVFRPFLTTGGHGVTQGYNTDGAVEFDTKARGGVVATRSLLAADLQTLVLNGINYFGFELDAGEPSARQKSLLSLDDIQIFLFDQPDKTGFASFTNPIYSMDVGTADPDNWVRIDGRTSGQGQGSSDMFMLIPQNLFGDTTGKYVYLYTKFGVNHADEGAFNEWRGAVGPQAAPIPEPGSILLMGTGLAASARWIRRRRTKSTTEV